MTDLIFNPPVIAHRGASGYAPENTLAAFYKAKQLGIHWVELDVQLSGDGRLIIFHDETLERTTDGQGKVHEHSWEYLQTLDGGSWFGGDFLGERLIDFQQAIEFFTGEDISLNVELKPSPGQEEVLVRTLLKEVKLMGVLAPSMLFSSFSISTLKYLRKQAPDVLIGLLMDEWLNDWRELAENLACVSVHFNQELATLERVQSIKSQNKKALCYTVNDFFRAQQLFEMGVDAVFSDFPDQVLLK